MTQEAEDEAEEPLDEYLCAKMHLVRSLSETYFFLIPSVNPMPFVYEAPQMFVQLI